MSAAVASLIPERRPAARPASQTTRILIVSDNPAASRAVATSLRQLGLDVLLCLFDGKTFTAMPVKTPDAILCHLTDYIAMAAKIAKVVRAHYAPRAVPMIGALSRPSPEHTNIFDSTLFSPMHSSQIANRVSSMVRLGIMEDEIKRRIATLREDFNQSVELASLPLNGRFRVLFIGKASPGFMIIINALQDKGVDVVAAFTSFSAFDYLHGEPFDAVVMNALEQSEPALTISETMRRNARLYHVPTLFIVNEDKFRDRDAAFDRGASDIISIDAEPDEIRGRVLELANYHRIHEQLKSEMFETLGGSCRDASNTVFSRDFFEAHLPRLLHDAQKNETHITLIGLRIVPSASETVETDYLDAAVTEAGTMVRDLVRMQDVVCRYGPDQYLIAFYGTDASKAASILNRITSIIESVAFKSSGKSASALTLELESSIVEAWPGATGQIVIQEALAELS